MEIFNPLLWLDFIFPKFNINHSSIHFYLTDNEINGFKPKLKKLSVKLSTYLEKIVVLSNYHDPLIKDLIERAKFGGEIAIAEDLAKIILVKIWDQNTIFLPSPDILVQVPPDPLRYLMRGYHLPSKIASNLSKMIDIPAMEIIQKTKTSKAQVGLNRKERLTNLNGLFKLDNRKLLSNPGKIEVVWLLDDLVSTGRTMEVCAKEIKKEFPFVQIYGISISGN